MGNNLREEKCWLFGGRSGASWIRRNILDRSLPSEYYGSGEKELGKLHHLALVWLVGLLRRLIEVALKCTRGQNADWSNFINFVEDKWRKYHRFIQGTRVWWCERFLTAATEGNNACIPQRFLAVTPRELWIIDAQSLLIEVTMDQRICLPPPFSFPTFFY